MEGVHLRKGQSCWFHTGQPGLTKGKCVHVFDLDGYAVPEHYVVEVETHVDPVLYVRDPLTVSDNAEKPIGCRRK